MVRVNSRLFKKQGLSLDRLFSAMVTSAKETEGTQKAFLKPVERVQKLGEAGKLNFDKSSLEDFDREMNKENYLPCHHSERYRRSNKPVYIISKRQIFKRIFNIN